MNQNKTLKAFLCQLIGKVKSSVSGPNSCSQSTRIVYQTEFVWSHLSETGQGPVSVPFATSFPATFRDGANARPLPPSYEIAYPGNPSLSARCSYHLKIIVQYRSSLWPKKKTCVHPHWIWRPPNVLSSITIPVTYIPRKRPPQPLLRGCDFRSTVKALPEEWFESSSILMPRRLDDEPLQAHVRLYLLALTGVGPYLTPLSFTFPPSKYSVSLITYPYISN